MQTNEFAYIGKPDNSCIKPIIKSGSYNLSTILKVHIVQENAMKSYIHHIANLSFFKVTKSANNLTFKLKKNQPCRNKIKVYTEYS